MLPRAGEKRPWDETSGVDIEFETAMLQVMRKHGMLSTSSTSSGRKLVSQETQTDLSGVVVSLDRSRNKISDELSLLRCLRGL